MADPVGKLDIQVGFDLDKSSLTDISRQVASFHKTLSKTLMGSENKDLQPFLPVNLKTIGREYKTLTSSLKKTYGFNDKQIKTVIDNYFRTNDNNFIGLKLAQQAGVKKVAAKNWTLQQLASKSDRYELLKKEYQEEGYTGGSLTRKLNKEFGRGYSQSYEKAKNTKAFKLLKEETKLKQKGLPFLKEMGKLGGMGKFLKVLGPIGKAGAFAYPAYLGFKANEGIYREKQTYTGYSKALREAVNVYGGGQKGVDALSSFYGRFYGFQEKLQRGMADTSIFEKLAKATGDSELIDSLMKDDTKTFFTNVLKKAAQLRDAEAYNLFQAIGFSPDVGMDLVKDVRSGEFQKYLIKRGEKEHWGEPSGKTSLKAGESLRKGVTVIKDYVRDMPLDMVSTLPDAISNLGKNLSNRDLISSAYRTAAGSNNTYNYNFNNSITATGDMNDAVGGMSTLVDTQQRNVYNEQKVR